jgi:hypothetical protein
VDADPLVGDVVLQLDGDAVADVGPHRRWAGSGSGWPSSASCRCVRPCR